MLFSPLTFQNGKILKNRFMLAPLTNLQSHADGTLSDDEYHWLTLRAAGGFGLTMTCAASIHASGIGFPGQLGAHSDDHIEGLTRLADGLHAHNTLAIVQLHHAGMRSPKEVIGRDPMCPSDDDETGARAMSHDEIVTIRDAFIAGAVRSQKAGFDGVEIHGAHGYLLCQFISPQYNRRTDAYGGALANRTRLIDEIITGIRQSCGQDFTIGLRLSPERFGMQMAEIISYFDRLCAKGVVDFIDMSLWDYSKEPEEEAFKGLCLNEIFCKRPRGKVKLAAAGKIMTSADVMTAMSQGLDFVALGRAAILHHDYPLQMQKDENFTPVPLPVSRSHLAAEGLGPKFLDYMATWQGFVADDPSA